MRHLLSFRNFLQFSLFAIILFPSCNNNKEEKNKVIITITAANPNGSLTMVDEHGNSAVDFKVKPGKEIEWQISTSTVENITDMPMKSTSPMEVLEGKPTHKPSSKSWVGKVKGNVKKDDTEEYTIKWHGSDGKDYEFDPKIIINP